MCLSSPFRDNSPKNITCETSTFNCPVAKRMATAIGTSKNDPSFGRSPGARFTVILCAGRSAPVFLIAERTLSRDSSTALSGRPTIEKEGSPFEISASTTTCIPSSPLTLDESTFANIPLLSIMRKTLSLV